MHGLGSDTVYPVTPDAQQRAILLEIVEPVLQHWDDHHTPDTTQKLRAISPLIEDLKVARGEQRAAFEILLTMVRGEQDAKTIAYAVQKVSERKFVVVQRKIAGYRNFTAGIRYTIGPYDDQSRTPAVVVETITSRMNYDEAWALYGHLVMKKELPIELKKFLLSEQKEEDDA